MTVFYSAELAGWGSVPKAPLPSGNAINANIRVHKATVTYAAQTTSDTILIAVPRKGDTFLFGIITADTSSGSTTLAIGTTASAAKYKAAAAFTATDTPTFFGKAGAMAALTADEEVIITLAAATAPGSGTLVIEMFFSQT